MPALVLIAIDLEVNKIRARHQSGHLGTFVPMCIRYRHAGHVHRTPSGRHDLSDGSRQQCLRIYVSPSYSDEFCLVSPSISNGPILVMGSAVWSPRITSLSMGSILMRCSPWAVANETQGTILSCAGIGRLVGLGCIQHSLGESWSLRGAMACLCPYSGLGTSCPNGLFGSVPAV